MPQSSFPTTRRGELRPGKEGPARREMSVRLSPIQSCSEFRCRPSYELTLPFQHPVLHLERGAWPQGAPSQSMPTPLHPTKGAESSFRCAFQSLGSLGRGSFCPSLAPGQQLLSPGCSLRLKTCLMGMLRGLPSPSILCSASVWTKPTLAWRAGGFLGEGK